MTQHVRYTRKETMERLEFVVSGCESGKLSHKQGWYHCGTAHCIAGWLQVIDHFEETNQQQFEHREPELNYWAVKVYGYAMEDEGSKCSVYDEYLPEYYVMARYELTKEEERDLFGGHLSLEEIRTNLERMKESDDEE